MNAHSPLPLEFPDAPFRVELVGLQDAIGEACVGDVGRSLMDRMWSEIRRLGLAHRGINHWVYLSGSRLFTGVELAAPATELGSLERLRVELPQYARYVHRGPYTELPGVWERVLAELALRGEKRSGPDLEIYGHWHDDPAQLTTTIVIGLAV